MNRHRIGNDGDGGDGTTITHIALISLYSTHRRQTALSVGVGVAGRLFMTRFFIYSLDFRSALNPLFLSLSRAALAFFLFARELKTVR